MELCKVKECERQKIAKGFCNTHYRKMKRTGTLKRLVFGKEWKAKQSEVHKTELTKLDPTPDPKHRGFLAVNVVNDIKFKAIKRGKKWKLTNVEAYQLITAPCKYCGCAPKWPKERVGIDRLYNKGEYTIKNCVSCCFTCNSAKGTKTVQQFYDWIRLVYNRLRV